jgi:hypothetical protein
VNLLQVGVAKVNPALLVDQGKLVIQSLYSEDSFTISVKNSVTGIQLDREFAKKSVKPFIASTSNGNISLYEKGWFNNYRETLITSNEGAIHVMKQRKTFLAWANSNVLLVFSCNSGFQSL